MAFSRGWIDVVRCWEGHCRGEGPFSEHRIRDDVMLYVPLVTLTYVYLDHFAGVIFTKIPFHIFQMETFKLVYEF